MEDDSARPGTTVAPRRRWRGVALAGVALTLVAGGIATANAATVSGTGDKGGRTVLAKDPTGGAKGVAGLVNAANAFLGTLGDDQRAEVLLDFTEENATAWSNLPCAGTCRPGIELGTLDDDQLAAAKAVLAAATGTGTGTGFDQISNVMAADDLLAADYDPSTGPGGGTPPSASATPSEATPSEAAPSEATPSEAAPSGAAPSGAVPSGGPGGGGGPGAFSYGSGFYYLAFLGTPSTTGTWQLNFGGHHLAVHLTYEKGKVTSASPYFLGVEPISYTDADGKTVETLAAQKNAIAALTGSFNAKQLTAATLAQSFNDVLVGPQKDGQFPETKEGVAVRTLSARQKKLVLAAIKPWVSVAADSTAQQLMKIYESELDRTFVGISGGTGYDTQGDYVRIDGPSVWIEFATQNGVVYNTQIHYHTVYRDHTRDYGGEFSF
ncbi:DUF3500 domain-containing protein [Actinoplanes sp. RD1]|uniref:DUF3500 domain-containing protein n=1 Tax=Actinoplanes sp. RD1 TaxID=3064538 RepID=UPI0027424661|nr:DUF3500 domain-containing protein [Actinoplanes sp. RD1]